MPEQNKPDIPESSEEEVFLYTLLRKMGSSEEEAITYTKIMFKTISEPILERMDASSARMEDQFELFKDVLNERLKSQETKYTVLIWVIGASTVILSIVLTLLTVLGGD